MPRDRQIVPAELRQDDHAALFVRLKAVRLEVHVQALHVAHALIMPAAGVVDQPRGVEPAEQANRILRVKLPPALVERHPQDNARAVLQLRDQFLQLAGIAVAPLRVRAGKKPVMAVLEMNAGDERCGDGQQIVLSAAGGHILPDQHAQPVAVIIPAHRLNFDVLAQHIEAQPLHERNIIDQRLVRRRGIQSVRPVALIEHAMVEIRLPV